MTPPQKKPPYEAFRSAGLLLAIPALLIASPLLGLFAGMAADRWLGTGRVLTAVGIVLGFATAGRETYRIYRRVQAESEEEERKKRP